MNNIVVMKIGKMISIWMFLYFLFEMENGEQKNGDVGNIVKLLINNTFILAHFTYIGRPTALCRIKIYMRRLVTENPH